ncbi:MAG: hypothetical protein M1299_12135 [Firmicutes bacterium]|nr:hypothetical protein [Bacillota bacterium]
MNQTIYLQDPARALPSWLSVTYPDRIGVELRPFGWHRADSPSLGPSTHLK